MATFRSHAGESWVVFGSAAAAGTAGTVRFEAAGPGGLILPIDHGHPADGTFAMRPIRPLRVCRPKTTDARSSFG